MKTVCKKNQCAGCMACINSCPLNAIAIKDELKFYNAVIDEAACVGCGKCFQVCPQNNKPELYEPMTWSQGWAEDPIRKKSSSGGIAACLSYAFVKNGGYVCSCLFENGKFQFKITSDTVDLYRFAGSKYVKSDPSGVYKEIRKLLLDGEKVLFIGLPCQVSGIKNFVGSELERNFYTIDLICHGTPSPKVLELFLNGFNITLSKINDIQFREKTRWGVYVDRQKLTALGILDDYMIGFLGGLFYTDNCYECAYARKERCSDITLGDSWGSELPPLENENGISLVLCQTAKGRAMLEHVNIHIEVVDIDKAIAANHQLRHPSTIHKNRDEFFRLMKNRIKFHKIIIKCCFKQSLKQYIKNMFIKIHQE